MNLDTILRQAEPCLTEDMSGELLVFHPEKAVTLHLNGSSAVVWGLCDGKRTTRQIMEQVVATFPKQQEQIPSDIKQLIADFLEQDFLQIVT